MIIILKDVLGVVCKYQILFPNLSNCILEFVLSLPEEEPIDKVIDKPPIIATEQQQKEMQERLATDSEITRISNTTRLSFE
jgi:hypothetical protein